MSSPSKTSICESTSAIDESPSAKVEVNNAKPEPLVKEEEVEKEMVNDDEKDGITVSGEADGEAHDEQAKDATHIAKKQRVTFDIDDDEEEDKQEEHEQPEQQKQEKAAAKIHGPRAISLDHFIEVGAAPEACTIGGEPCCLGIDEAGRGPVLGPMIYGAAFWPVEESDSIASLGFDDSKALSEEKRDGMFEVIAKEKARIGYVLATLSAEFISTKMMSRSSVSLNKLSHDAAIALIRKALDLGVNVTEIYVDTVGDPVWYQRRLESLFGHQAKKIVVCPKADSIYKVVGAASICAKVTRDRMTHDLLFDRAGVQLHRVEGTGYPGDPKTKDWLVQNAETVFGYPEFARFSWSTIKTICGEDRSGQLTAVAKSSSSLSSENKNNKDKKKEEGGGCGDEDGEHETAGELPDDHSFLLTMRGLARVHWEEDTGGNTQITRFFGKGKAPARPPFFSAKRMMVENDLLL